MFVMNMPGKLQLVLFLIMIGTLLQPESPETVIVAFWPVLIEEGNTDNKTVPMQDGGVETVILGGDPPMAGNTTSVQLMLEET